MKTLLLTTAVVALSCGAVTSQGPPAEKPQSVRKTAAFDWLDVALEVTAREHERNGARPTIGSRMLGIVVTAMYDAWAAYDDKAVGTRLGHAFRRPPGERTVKNQEIALAYATYRTLVFLFPEDADWLTGELRRRGLDPANTSTDPSTPAGVGNRVAQVVIAYRRHDGANQLGDEVGSDGTPYSDWTFYRCKNTVESCVDPDAWQPITFSDGKGGSFAPGFLTPHWYRVKPFALARSDLFRPPPPPRCDSEQMKREVDEVIRFNASLTPEQKAIVEFMRDGPRSTGQSGHWLRFAQEVSRRDKHTLDQDVKLFFAVGNVAMDAFIAAWDCKRIYDGPRPWSLVRYYYAGKTVPGWAGPGQGVRDLPAEKWHPYSPDTFVTPPFPGYVSGHSTVSAACARTLALFTGSDHFGEIELRKAGSLTEANFACELMQAVNGKVHADGKMTCDVSLKLPTFSATAEMAGISRVMGGYHVQADNVEGHKLGRRVAEYVWPKTRAYFDGTAAARE